MSTTEIETVEATGRAQQSGPQQPSVLEGIEPDDELTFAQMQALLEQRDRNRSHETRAQRRVQRVNAELSSLPAEVTSAEEGLKEMPDHAVTQLIADQQQTDHFRMNASLPDESWKRMDDAIYDTFDSVLRLVQDLRSLGLVYQESIFNKSTEWHVQDDTHEADVVMDPETTVAEEATTVDLRGSPLPIVQDAFSIGFRDRVPNGPWQGGAIDTLEATNAARAVAETVENLVINGWPSSEPGDGYTLYGLTNHPSINTGTLTDWDDSSAADIRGDLRQMAESIKDNQIYPEGRGFLSYISRDFEYHLDDIDPDGDGNLLVRDRIEGLSDIGDVRVADFLPSQSALMFRPTRDVIDLAVAAEEQSVQWEGPGGLRSNYQIMSCICPRVKATRSGQSGVAYYTY